MLRLLAAALVPVLASAADPQAKPKPVELPPTQFPDIVFPDIPPPPRGPKGEAPPKDAVAAYLKKVEERDARLVAVKAPEPAADDTPLAKLAKAKLKAVCQARHALHLRMRAIGDSLDDVRVARDLAAAMTDAADDAFDKPADRAPWYEHRVLVAKADELLHWHRAQAGLGDGPVGVGPPHALAAASAARLDAEIALLKLKAKIGK